MTFGHILSNGKKGALAEAANFERADSNLSGYPNFRFARWRVI
jgi:hypothetical protein